MTLARKVVDHPPVELVGKAFELILSALFGGTWSEDEGLRDTPLRAARAFLELVSGYWDSPEQRTFEEPAAHLRYEDLIVVAGVKFASLCEHHLLPFIGRMHVAYIPRGRVLGLSKIPRIISIMSRRLQVQERLTAEVAKAVAEAAGTPDIMVVSEAVHLCMCLRGPRECAPVTVIVCRGVFEASHEMRRRVLELIEPYRFVFRW